MDDTTKASNEPRPGSLRGSLHGPKAGREPLERVLLRGSLYLVVAASILNMAGAGNPSIIAPLCLATALAGLAASSRPAD